MRILVIEDDPQVRDLIAHTVSEHGWRVTACATLEAGLAAALDDPPDVVLMDLGLPDGSGLEGVAKLRDEGLDRPILVITGKAGAPNVVRGLDVGADDYIVKPFDARELVARIQAAVRRAATAGVLRHGPLALDQERDVLEVRGTPVRVTPVEFRLLRALMLGRGDVVSREALLSEVWGIEFDPKTKIIDVHVSNLRRKLSTAGAGDVIATVPGRGYSLAT